MTLIICYGIIMCQFGDFLKPLVLAVENSNKRNKGCESTSRQGGKNGKKQDEGSQQF